MSLVSRLRAYASKAIAGLTKASSLNGVDSNRGWMRLFSSNEASRWQSDSLVSRDTALTFAPLYACITLIASDIAKIPLRLMELRQGVWIETTSAAFSPLLRKPNHFQTRQQFIETWVLSKVTHGNTYVLKVRDKRQVVIAQYVLDPTRVTPLVAPDGAVYYQLQEDPLSKLPFSMPAVPASEIIHDRMECLFHPLVGVSPITACYLPATQGMRIQQNSEAFFKNMSRPSGMLSGPGVIDDETAARLKRDWEENFSGEKIGRLAVLGDDLKYLPMTVNPVDAQLVDQLKLSAVQICSAMHVPAYMVGVGETPSYNNVEALNQQYYTQCLQKFFNAIEDLEDDGLGLLPLGYRSEFDLDDLIRMDTTNRVKSINESMKAGWLAPDEARAKFGYLPTAGGASPMMQQQNFSLAALAKRDAQADPFARTNPPPPAPSEEDEPMDVDEAKSFLDHIKKGLECDQT